jgi:hypothetical protein
MKKCWQKKSHKATDKVNAGISFFVFLWDTVILFTYGIGCLLYTRLN